MTGIYLHQVDFGVHGLVVRRQLLLHLVQMHHWMGHRLAPP
eukprot:COSAG03_NODE_26764_length_257_cov_0.651899_1_plen_40_part_01